LTDGRTSTNGSPVAEDPTLPVYMEFDDNLLLSELCGAHDEHLARLEKHLDVRIVAKGNRVSISGTSDGCNAARQALRYLYDRLKRGRAVDRAEVEAAARLAQSAPADGDGPTGDREMARYGDDDLTIRTRKRVVSPRSHGQAEYIRALNRYELVFGLGPAGTGKTYLAVAKAVEMMQAGKVERIILSRPAVEAGERLGFLPGELRDKMDPYLRPLYDALYDMLPMEQVNKRLEAGEIEVAPLAFMRGRTLANAFIILDEAQNTTPVQMKMLLTRMGENSRMAVTGDLSQVDLPRGVLSGLRHALRVLSDIDQIKVVRFTAADVIRHELVARIVNAYDAREGRQEELDLGDDPNDGEA
jgi:phosphate starvation-inducible PhoH-like protein